MTETSFQNRILALLSCLALMYVGWQLTSICDASDSAHARMFFGVGESNESGIWRN